MKIVINKCFGGFGLSRAAVELARELSKNDNWGGVRLVGEKYENGTPVSSFLENHYHPEIERNDEILVKVVEELGERAHTPYSELLVVNVPDEVEWEIDEYDGLEKVVEKHRSWG